MSSRGFGGTRPEVDQRPLQIRPRGSVRALKGIVDDDVGLALDRESDDARDRRVDRFGVRRGRARPRFELERIVEGKVFGLDRSPRERRPRGELRAERRSQRPDRWRRLSRPWREKKGRGISPSSSAEM